MRSHAPARRLAPSLRRPRHVHEDEETAEAVQPNDALLRMATHGAYDDEPTVTAYVDASDDGFLVPCVHAAPAPATMPVVPRQLVEDIEQYARASIARHYAWSASHPAPVHAAGYASGAYPAPGEASGIHGAYASGIYGAYGAPRMAHAVATRPSRRARGGGDLVRNLAAVCVGLVGALAIGTAAIVWRARPAPAPVHAPVATATTFATTPP